MLTICKVVIMLTIVRYNSLILMFSVLNNTKD